MLELIDGDEWAIGLRRVIIARTTPKFVWFNTENGSTEKMRKDAFLRQALNVEAEMVGYYRAASTQGLERTEDEQRRYPLCAECFESTHHHFSCSYWVPSE